MDFLNLYPEAFGLDISDLSLKVVKLKSRKGVFELACFGDFPIKPGIIEKGEIKDKEALVATIKDAVKNVNPVREKFSNGVKQEKLNTNYAVVSLPEEKAFLEIIKMPKMEEERLKKSSLF